MGFNCTTCVFGYMLEKKKEKKLARVNLYQILGKIFTSRKYQKMQARGIYTHTLLGKAIITLHLSFTVRRIGAVAIFHFF